MKIKIFLIAFFILTFLPIKFIEAQTEDSSKNTPENAQETPVKLKEVTVFGNLDEARNRIVPSLGGSKYTIDEQQIKNQSQGSNSPFNQVLLRAPGVAQDSFGQVHIRGEHAELQYRFNDVLLPEGISGFGQDLDTRFVDSVSLITGTLPAQYGFRTAGIVDIHTKSGAFSKGLDLSMYGGSFNTVKPSFEWGGSKGKFNYYFTGTYLQDSLGIENPTNMHDAIHDNTRQFKGFGYMSYVINDTSRFNVMLSSFVGHFQIPNTPGLSPEFDLNGVPTFDSTALNERQHEQNHYGVLAYQRSTDKLDFQAAVFGLFSKVKFLPDPNGDLIFNGVASDVNRNITSSGFQFDSSYRINDKHTLRTGALFTGSITHANTSTAVFSTDADGNQTSNIPFSIIDNTAQTGFQYGIYAQDEFKVVKPLTLNFGFRFDGFNAFINEYQVSPRFNLVYTPTDKTTLHAGYARYFTPPPLELINNQSIAKFDGTTNASAITQNSPVKSERSNYFDIGVSQKILKGFQVGVDGYVKLAHNQLDEGQFGQALIFAPFNYRHGRVYGVEFTSTYNNHGFSAYANFAYSVAKGKEITSGEFLFDPDELAFIHDNYVHLDHDQTFTGSVGVAYTFKDTTVYTDLLVGSGLRKGFANSEHLAAYAPWNIGASHLFKLHNNEIQGIQTRFDVVNLLDETYELRDGSGIGVGAPQFGMRRGFFGGVSLLFGNPPSHTESQEQPETAP